MERAAAQACGSDRFVTWKTIDPVTGVDPANVWATADYTRTLQVYRVAKNTYCATWRDSGTFVTVAGQSPGGTGTVAKNGKSGTVSITLVDGASKVHEQGSWVCHVFE